MCDVGACKDSNLEERAIETNARIGLSVSTGQHPLPHYAIHLPVSLAPGDNATNIRHSSPTTL